MALMLPGLMFVVLIAIFALLGREGLWSNLINLVNAVTAGLVAMNFFEPLAVWCRGKLPSGTYVWDFFILWALFIFSFTLFRVATDFASRVKVRFPKMLDLVGSFLLAAVVGWVFICFAWATLHTAPFGREFMFGGFKAESDMLFGLAPDRKWLAFTQKMSRGAYARGGTIEDPAPDSGAAQTTIPAHTFDPKGEFIPKYASRRTVFEGQTSILAKKR